MTGDLFEKLENSLYEKPRMNFGNVLPWTFFGALGGAAATSFQLLNYLRTPKMEGFVRFMSGSADSFLEGLYAIGTEVPKYFGKSNNKGGPVVYYVGGKLLGAALSWLPDYILRNMGIDTHSAFPGSIVPTAYAQLDQMGAYLGMLVYHTKKHHSIRKGFAESIRDPVSQTSLMVTCMSVGIDAGVRTKLMPTNFWHDWVETWSLSFLCLMPVWRGKRTENKS